MARPLLVNHGHYKCLKILPAKGSWWHWHACNLNLNIFLEGDSLQSCTYDECGTQSSKVLALSSEQAHKVDSKCVNFK